MRNFASFAINLKERTNKQGHQTNSAGMAAVFLRKMSKPGPEKTFVEHILGGNRTFRERFLLRQLFPLVQSGHNSSSSGPTDTAQEAEGIKANPYYEKYATKIKKAQSEGHVVQENQPKDKLSHQLDIEKAQWKRRIEELEKKLEGKDGKDSFAKGSKLPKSLSGLLKMEMIEGKSTEEIAEIWREYFKGKDCISAVIPATSYDRIYSRAQSCPTFIYPLPRQQGYEIFLAQFSGHQCFFTSLVNYQAHGEEAPWQMNIVHYTELKEEKGIVLMTSEVDMNNMNILESQCLAQMMQMFYATADEERFNHVRTFNQDPHNFRYMDVVKEVESSGIKQPVFSTK